MTQVQLQGLLHSREQLQRARKEYEFAMLHDTHYRGVRTMGPAQQEPIHGKFTYRGVSYLK